jgi:5'(3')-deoxyribonucleotidase
MTSNPNPIVLGVDLDGVCADFYARMREVAAEWLEKPIEDLTTEITWGLPEWGIKVNAEYLSLHRFAVKDRDLFRTAPMIPGARRVLRQLSDEKYRIRIITNRLFIHFFHAVTVQQTTDWLDHHGIPYWDLCFMKDKGQVGAHIYIDDAPHNVQRLRDQGCATVCFANSTNRHVADPRAKDWDEAYQLIKAVKPPSCLFVGSSGSLQGAEATPGSRIRGTQPP